MSIDIVPPMQPDPSPPPPREDVPTREPDNESNPGHEVPPDVEPGSDADATDTGSSEGNAAYDRLGSVTA